jgi:(p)ppGpp synthase/HD superfamily hydrolase
MATFDRALHIALEAHKNQKDKNGAPYILHVMRVMMRGKNEDEKIVGVLHDLVEDTAWTFQDLRREGFSEHIIEAVRCLTRPEEEPYDHFIERIKTNRLAIAVKLNDLEDNMDVRRLQKLEENHLVRLNKYLKAYHALINLK